MRSASPRQVIRNFDVGSKLHIRYPGQQKYIAYQPLLSEVIDSVEAYAKLHKRPKPSYGIEIKTMRKGDLEFHPEPGEFAHLAMDVVEKKKMCRVAGKEVVQLLRGNFFFHQINVNCQGFGRKWSGNLPGNGC